MAVSTREGRVLEGVRVLSFAQVISAPSAVRMLVDLGAEVIKIEPPSGDVMRRIRPFKRDARGAMQSGIFVALNCGQRSLALDLRRTECRAIARRLCLEWAHVVVSNFTPGKMDELGLGDEELRQARPDLIWGCISGYGQRGPWAHRRAYDLCVQGECGLTAQNGSRGGKPHRIGFSAVDYLSGRDLVIGILGALFQRQRTGQGQLIDCSLYNSGVSVLEDAIPGFDLEGRVPGPTGSTHPSAAPHGLYRSRDGYVNIIVIDNRLWARLCQVMERSDLLSDPRFAEPKERIENRDELDALVESWTRGHSTDELLDLLERAELPCGKLCDIRDVIDSPQTRYWEMAPLVEQPHLGPVRINGCPIHLSASSTAVRGPAPLLGQHNREVLGSILGLPEAEIERLEADGAIAAECG